MPGDSFAAATERVLARQALRQAEAKSASESRETALKASSLGQLPYPINRSAHTLSSFWSTLLRSEGVRPAFRVGQVDSELLDEELLSLLKGQIGEGLKYFGAHLQDDWSKEITLVLRAALFKLSIWDHDASYGASLQNLRFSDARKRGLASPPPTRMQKSLYGLITVCGRYGWDRWMDWLIQQEGGYTTPSTTVHTLSRLTEHLSTFHSITAFGSFIVFLVNGRYRTLTDRILRLRLVSPVSQISREVSFEYLNRQLVWHAFTEFLLFLLPLVGISRWRRWLSRAWSKTRMALQAEAEDEKEETKKGPLAYLPERTCAICYQDQNPTSTSEAEVLGANMGAGGGVIGSATTDVVNPYEAISCGCIYCFVCLATKIEGEEGAGWMCLRCGEVISKCKPWSGDIVAERKSRNPGKNVGFADEEEKLKFTDNMDKESEIPSDLGSSQWMLEGDSKEDVKD